MSTTTHRSITHRSIQTTLGALLLSAASVAPAVAALGGSADSVSADNGALHGQLRATPFVQYDVQQIASATLTVNEYLTRAGQVFAITWSGATPPDLQRLLGSYFGRTQAAAVASHQASPGIHRLLVVSDTDLVVQIAGRLRDFRGIAYLPALVPAGVSIGDLQ